MTKTVNIADKTTLDVVKDTSSEILEAVKKAQSDIKRYGVRIKKSEPHASNRVEYIHDAVGMTPAYMNFETGAFDYGSWKDVWFVKDNKPVMLNSNGTIAYKLNPDDYSLKEDGTESDISNTAFDGNAMSMIPLTWVSMTSDGNYEYIVLADAKYDESFHAYAHTKDGEIKDNLFLAMFKGSLVDGKLRSIANQWMDWEKNASQEVTNAVANGDGWYTRTWAQRQLINAMLLVMGKSDNTQTVFGRGVDNTYVEDRNAHYGMIMPGSVMNAKGQFFGGNTGAEQVKVFHMEDWWGNQWERIAGLINDKGIIKVSMTGPYNTTGEGYTVIGCEAPNGTSGQYIKEVHTDEYGRIPVSTTGGSSSTYLCDGLWFSNAQLNYALVGGHCWNTCTTGASYLYLNAAPAGTNWTRGACLSYI